MFGLQLGHRAVVKHIHNCLISEIARTNLSEFCWSLEARQSVH